MIAQPREAADYQAFLKLHSAGLQNGYGLHPGATLMVDVEGEKAGEKGEKGSEPF